MDDQQDSSTGLIIAIIAGGVILALVVLGAVGAGFFLLARTEERAAAVALPPMAEKDIAAEVEKQADGPPWPNPERVKEQENKVVGIWNAKEFKDGRRETLAIRADKTMDWTIERPGKDAEKTTGKWELLVELGGPGVTIRYAPDKGKPTAWSLRFLDDDRFVVMPAVTAEVDGRPVENPNDKVIYERSPAEKKLFGAWEGKTDGGMHSRLHFNAGGRLEQEVWRTGDAKPRTTTLSRWEVVAANDNLVKIRNGEIFENAPPGFIHELHFQDNEKFTVRSGRYQATGDTIRLGGVILDGVSFQRCDPSGVKNK
jgi:hypothetical protein